MKWIIAWWVASFVLGTFVGTIIHNIDEREPKPKKNLWTEEELHRLGLR